MSGNNIKVVVRCRPLNAREKARGAVPLIRMEGNKTIISKPASPGSNVLEDPKAFTFDESYWSADKNDPDYADQERVYNDLGKEVLEHAFNGYNCCIFAYGQTGSGKSYSMVGYGEEKGIIPRTCSELFDRVEANKTETRDFQVEVSYIEIYNEKVRDLLNPSAGGNLKVREHPTLGPYVQDLSRLAVNSYKSLDQLMDEGNKARTVAATNMNETSSRSHAVFTIFVTQKTLDPNTKQVQEKVARISLVDLAGSERANSTGATGVRLKEGANINKSLTTLGKVIAGLAEQAQAGDKKGKKGKEAFVPFRDSVLTWLLKDSLGGNSKTCMIAAISPADYDETLSTLRYADQAKKIKTKAVVNEDPNAKAMRELKDEVEALRQALMVYNPEEVQKIAAITHPVKGSSKPAAAASVTKNPSAPATPTPTAARKTAKAASNNSLAPPVVNISPPTSKSTVIFTDAAGNTTELTKEEMVEQLKTTEKLLSEYNQTWEEKIKHTEEIHQETEKTLKNLGITIEKSQVGLYTPKEMPYLINLNEDPLMSECLMYNIKPGVTYVDQFNLEAEDSLSTDKPKEDVNYIRLSGSNINNNHCHFENNDNVVILYPRAGCTTMVNGMRISEPKRLKSGYRVILGDYHVFRFNNPGEALKEREVIQQQSQDINNDTPLVSDPPPSPTTSDKDPLIPPRPISPEVMDWNFARREAMLNTYIHDSTFDNFSNEDLDKLFDDVAKIRIIRKHQSIPSDTLSRRTSLSSIRRSVYSNTASSLFLDDAVDNYYTTDASTVSSISSNDDSVYMLSKDEQEFQIEQQRKKYEAKLRRLSRHMSYTQPPPISFTPREKELATKIAELWKRKRNVAMAKTILTYDLYLSQANALSVRAKKNVSYQFAVVHDNISATAVSHWDTSSSSSHQSKNNIDLDLIKTPKPCIAIQVIDRKHQAIYLWSIEKFMVRLRYLQGAYYASDAKRYVKGDDLFYEPTTPNFSLIGLAKVPLRNLATQLQMESSLSVFCRNTGRRMGELKVQIAPIARSVRHTGYSSGEEDQPEEPIEPIEDDDNPRNLLHVGQQLVFEISVIELSGINPKEFSGVHTQFRLSSFGESLDGVFASKLVEHKTDSPIQIKYHQTLSMAVTEEVLQAIQTKDITFEVYGKPTKAWVENAVSASDLTIASDQNIIKSILPSKKPDDLIARIQICEITTDGDYKPVPVESTHNSALGQHDTFSLQQGQQRRLTLSLQSVANLEKVVEIRIGQVRSIDSKHRIVDSPHNSLVDVPLNIISSHTKGDTLTVHGSWDSSLHDTSLLNGVTPSHQKVILTLSWTVRQKILLNGSEVDSTLKFEKELYVHIKDQNKAITMKRKSAPPTKRASIIHNFFSLKPTSLKSQVTALYSVEYRPDLCGTFLDLPLMESPSRILREYHANRLAMEKTETLDAIRYSVSLAEQLERICEPGSLQKTSSTRSFDTQTIVQMWQKKSDAYIFTPPAIDCLVKPTVRRWIPRVEQVIIPVNEETTPLKKGFLLRKNEITTPIEWNKFWCVLTGHHLFMYPDQFEVNEIDILNVKSYNKEKEDEVSKSKHLFTVDTVYDSHTFQAPDHSAKIEWISMFH